MAFLPVLANPNLAEVISSAATDQKGFSLVMHLNAWQTAIVNLGAIAFVVFGGSYLTRLIFRFIAVTQLRELFTASALMIVFGVSLLMSLVGLSPALGTFLAGVILANNEYRHLLESSIEPFKGLLLGLFFITVGASIDFNLLQLYWRPILLSAFGLVLLKCIVLLVLARIFGVRDSNGWLVSLGLAQAGEFAFVLISFSVANSIMPQQIADKLLLIVALSMLMTPLLFIVYDRLVVPFYSHSQEREADAIHESNHIIIAGRGRMGGGLLTGCSRRRDIRRRSSTIVPGSSTF